MTGARRNMVHLTPGLTLPGMLPLYSTGVCGESDFCRVTLGKILLPCIQEFPDPRLTPCEKKTLSGNK